MTLRTLHRIVIFLTLVFTAIGLYFYFTTDRNIFTAIFLRAGCIFLMASCFWKWILRIPPWAQIGWLPLAAAVIAWRPFLLKFAIPAAAVLILLNSPLGRGKYKKKNWRELGKSISEHKTRVEIITEPEPEPESRPKPKPEPKPEPKSESKPKKEQPLYGPNAQNTMFRALSRVAGRQVGKMMKK